MSFLKSLAVGLALALPLPAMAAQVGLDLEVTATGGGYLDGQTASGAVFWDDALLTGVGYETVSRSGAFGSIVDPIAGLFFDVGPGPIYTFTEADDDIGPFLTFLDGVLDRIDYLVTDGSTVFDLSAYGVKLFTFDIRSPVFIDANNTAHVDAIVKYLAPVPLPAGLPLLAGALGLFGALRLRRKAPVAA